MVEVRREVVLAQPLETVWEALTAPERLAEWFANDVEFTVERGGGAIFRWDDGSERTATFEEVEPLRRLAFRWHEEGREAEATQVELTLDAVAEGTRLIVVESAPATGPRASAASALVGEWSWGISLLAALPAVRRRVHAGS